MSELFTLTIPSQPGQAPVQIYVDDNSYCYSEIMSVPTLTLYFSLPQHIEISIGTSCTFQGEQFILMRPEHLKMLHTRNFEYTVTFCGVAEYAKIWKFRNPVDGRLKFPLTAKPHEHLQMFVDNMNRHDSGWTVDIDNCITDTEKLINYDHDFCWDALGKMAEAFDTEFEINGKCVCLHKVETNKSNPLSLEYGRGKGFKSGVGRANSSDDLPVRTLFVQGGTRNIDRSRYDSNELHLPQNATLGYDGEKFSDQEGYNTSAGREYIVDDLGLSIRRTSHMIGLSAEDSLDRSDDYPQRVGEISTVYEMDASKNRYDIVDENIPDDLDYSDCQIPGEELTIIFQSGQLAGREFVVNYVHVPKTVNGVTRAAKRFEIVPQEIDGVMMPCKNFLPAKGDTYIVMGCMLPDAYIRCDTDCSGAEWDMFRAAVRYLFDHEEQKFSFTGELDGIWAKKDWLNIGGKIKIGNFVSFTDARFQSTPVLVRIVGIKTFINNPHSPKIELSNETKSPGFTTSIKTFESAEVDIEESYKSAVNFTKRRFRDAKETMEMLQEAFADYFTESINPVAIETMQILVGDERLQFRFVKDAIATASTVNHQVAYNKDTKKLTANAGIIQHMTLGIDSLSSSHKTEEYRYYTVSAFTSPTLPVDTKLYLYIKASKGEPGEVSQAEFKISSTAKTFDDGDYNWFLYGVLNSEFDGERSFVKLFGFSEILPGRITTDSIVSGDGNSWFDMVANSFQLGDKLQFNTDGNGQLKIKGTIVQSQGGDAEAYIGCYRGVWQPGVTYYNGDEVIYTVNGITSYYRYIYATPASGIAPTNSVYWQVVAQGSKGSQGEQGEQGKPGEQGEPGPFTELRFQWGTSLTEAPTLVSYNRTPAGWTTSTPQKPAGICYLWRTHAIISGDGTTLLQNWSTPVRISPYDGTDGIAGPVVVFRGAYSPTETYYGTTTRCDAVKYGSAYYIARSDSGTFSGTTPTDTTKWNTFGASFESVATNLLLAEGANIGDWFVSEGKIVSAIPSDDDASTTPLITLDANVTHGSSSYGRIIVYSPEPSAPYIAESQDATTILIDSLSGIVQSSTSSGTYTYIAPSGIFANRAGTSCLLGASGITQRAAIVGIGNGNLDLDPTESSQVGIEANMVAGVYGTSANSGTAPHYGGYFKNLRACGLSLKPKYISADTQLSDDDTLIIGLHSSGVKTVILPAATRDGQTIFVRQMGAEGYIRIQPIAGQRLMQWSTPIDNLDCGAGQEMILHFTRFYINGVRNDVWIVTRVTNS